MENLSLHANEGPVNSGSSASTSGGGGGGGEWADSEWADSEWELQREEKWDDGGKGKKERTEELESCESFEGMGLDDNILYAIYQYGFEKPSPIQRLAVKPIIQGRDVIAQAQAGQGKTGAFTLSILQRIDPMMKKTQALVLVPTRVLADMHLEFMKAMGQRRGVNVTRCIGGTSMKEDKDAIRAGAHIVLGTPGRIAGLVEDGTLELSDLRILVMDEADELLRDDGYDGGFREVVKWIIGRYESITFHNSHKTIEINQTFLIYIYIYIYPCKTMQNHLGVSSKTQFGTRNVRN